MVSNIAKHIDLITGSGTITIDCGGFQIVYAGVKVTGTATITTINDLNIMSMYLVTEQDAVGGHAITMDSEKFETNNPTLSTGANKKDTWIFGFSGGKFHQHGFEADVS